MTFVAARCPQCGGEIQLDDAKETGFCMHCGSKVVVKEAIKAVRIDNSHMIDNWMNMGELAIESGNMKEAYDYFSKILEIDTNNWNAHYQRGKAAGWQSTLINKRLLETVTSFSKAIELVPADKKEELIIKSAEDIVSLALAFISLRTDRFEQWPDDDEVTGLINDINYVDQAIRRLSTESGVSISGHLESIARSIDSAVSSAYYGKILPDYNGSDYHPGEYQFYQYLERIDRCIKLIEKAIALSDADEDADIERYKQLIFFEKKALDSCSWDYDIYPWGKDWHKNLHLDFNAQALRKGCIKDHEKSISKIAERKRAAQIAKEEKDKLEAKKKEEEYWSAHPEEKAKKEKEEELAREKARIEKERLDELRKIEEEKQKITKKKKATKLLIIFIILLLVITTFVIVSKIIIPQNKINTANEKIKQNQLDEAIILVEDVLQRQPNNEDALAIAYTIANEKIDQNELDDALLIVDNILISQPDNEDALLIKYNIAAKNSENSQFERAVEIFNALGDYKDSNQLSIYNTYLIAEESFNNKDFPSAINILETLTSLDEAKDLLNETIYQYGLQLVGEEKFDEAISLFLSIVDYKDTESILFTYEISEIKAAEVGDIILFGTTINNPSLIKWKILDKQGNKIFIMAVSAVSEKAHRGKNDPDVTWADSGVRSYLNGLFYNNNFSEYEKEIILETRVSTNMGPSTNDNIFLLSKNEVEKYLPDISSRILSDSWWLRDNGDSAHVFMTVNGSGYQQGLIYSDGVYSNVPCLVRPVMWLNVGD
ncbi:hypothetical protein JW887_03515 [Candidatus Dojkabacteria bacterium]|nr:hypothetical protein [Candidatus Dojkabacteria bacterium]